VAAVETGRVLVVDDERDVREAVEQALELEGHRVATAVDGLDALQRLGRGEFDAIVLDVGCAAHVVMRDSYSGGRPRGICRAADRCRPLDTA
jgi:CheY-like chemotaxis protein